MILTQKLWVLSTGTFELSNFLISYPTDVTRKEDWLSSFGGGMLLHESRRRKMVDDGRKHIAIGHLIYSGGQIRLHSK